MSKIQPLLKGEILIEDKMYALNEVRLSNNEGIVFPYINNLSINIIQQLNKYGRYYLPTYVRMESSLEVNFSGLLKVDKVSLEQLNIITNYRINGTIPDSIVAAAVPFSTKKLKIKTETLSRAKIDSLRPIPLNSQEVKGYAELDSTKTIESKIKISGPLSGLVPKSFDQNPDTSSILKAGMFLLSKTYFRDNRVDGIVIGAKHSGKIIKDKLFFDVAAGYSFERKKFEGNTKLNLNLKSKIFDRVDVSIFHEPKQWQLMNPYHDVFNSLSVLLGFEDQFNYYISSGFSLGIRKDFMGLFSTKTEFIYEKEESIPSVKYKSIFRTNRSVRDNPQITEGFDRKISFTITGDNNPITFQIIPQSGFIFRAEISNPILASDFNYKKFHFVGQVKANTLYKELFVAPYILFMLEGGMVIGEYGPQHIITPNSALGYYSPFGSQKLLKPYQYVGDKMIALHAEHNWRTTPFQAAGIDFMTNLSFDLLTGISVLKMWNDSNYFGSNSLNKFYWETYAGFSRIFGFFRIDFTYNSNKKFGARAALAILL
jgi:hypothetical protein